MIRTLKAMPYAQAKVIDNGSANRRLISYATTVIYLEDGWLTVTGLYSATTRRHIGAFMRELGFDYYVARALWNTHTKLNIFTGEILPA